MRRGARFARPWARGPGGALTARQPVVPEKFLKVMAEWYGQETLQLRKRQIQLLYGLLLSSLKHLPPCIIPPRKSVPLQTAGVGRTSTREVV